jgi:hypothetical protein
MHDGGPTQRPDATHSRQPPCVSMLAMVMIFILVFGLLFHRGFAGDKKRLRAPFVSLSEHEHDNEPLPGLATFALLRRCEVRGVKGEVMSRCAGKINRPIGASA